MTKTVKLYVFSRVVEKLLMLNVLFMIIQTVKTQILCCFWC